MQRWTSLALASMALFATLALGGCGQKGPLMLPPAQAASGATH
jgi:predicted small lipoprotein YifL